MKKKFIAAALAKGVIPADFLSICLTKLTL